MDEELDKISQEGPDAWRVYFVSGTICAAHKWRTDLKRARGWSEVVKVVGELRAEEAWAEATSGLVEEQA